MSVVAVVYVLTSVSAALLTWALAPFIRVILEAKPRIVKETTRPPMTLLDFVSRVALKRDDDCSVTGETFDDLILPDDVKQRLIDLTWTVRSSHEQGIPLTHFILHGPDGVGKQMAARLIARFSGIDFARVCGGEIGASGEKGVSQIQALFSWANTSSDGLLIYISQADAFLGSSKSSLMKGTGSKHNAASAFLLNVSKLRKGIILVPSTCREHDLDEGVLAHFDKSCSCHLPLPDSSCRKKLVEMYFNRSVVSFVQHNNESNRRTAGVLSIEDDLITGEQFGEIVAATRGLSGDAIRDLIVAMRQVLIENRTLTFSSAWELIEMRAKHHQDMQVLAGEHTLTSLDGDFDLQDVTFV
ncbi:hypothetical protein ACHAWF_007392 [Thalassiosira exigua]